MALMLAELRLVVSEAWSMENNLSRSLKLAFGMMFV